MNCIYNWKKISIKLVLKINAIKVTLWNIDTILNYYVDHKLIWIWYIYMLFKKYESSK